MVSHLALGFTNELLIYFMQATIFKTAFTFIYTPQGGSCLFVHFQDPPPSIMMALISLKSVWKNKLY